MVKKNKRLEWGLKDEERGQLAKYLVPLDGYAFLGIQRKGGVSEMVSRNTVMLFYHIDLTFKITVANRFRRCITFDLPRAFEKRSSTIDVRKFFLPSEGPPLNEAYITETFGWQCDGIHFLCR